MKFFEEFQQYLATEKRFSPHTLEAYSSDLEQFSSFASSQYELTDINRASSQIIRSWVIHLMDNNISTRTVNRKLSTLKTYFKFLMRGSHIEVNPMSKVTSPKNGSRLPVYMEKNDMESLLSGEIFEEGFSGIRDKLVIMLFYCTGMRRSELINLKVGAYDLHNGSIKVLGKGNKERIIPIAGELKELLDKYIVERNKIVDSNEESLIITDKGKKIYANYVYRLVKGYLSKVSTAQKKSPHVLRHTFATHMLNNGADLNAIKEILGHANLSATQVYTHNSVEKLKQIYEQAHPKA